MPAPITRDIPLAAAYAGMTDEELYAAYADADAQVRAIADANAAVRGGLPGSDLPWGEWLRTKYSHFASKPLVQRHVDLYEWFDALERGTKPEPEVQPWARGSGKTTTGALGVTRVGSKLSRRFVLYITLTQEQADYQVQTMEGMLTTAGAEPRMSRMGRAKGWRRDQLQTQHGFNVAGFGMDSALRGIKIDECRPDLIWFDDIDSLEDTLETINKKIRAITLNILPAGSTDSAILFTGNKVHAASIISRLIDGRAKFLLNRNVKPAVPAVEGLEVEEYIGDNGLTQYRITGGEATWPGGQPIATCEAQMNEWGYPAFMREAQHDVRVGGTFFPQFEDREPYVIPARFTYENPPPPWYTVRVGLDWGYADPFAFVVDAIDETSRHNILESYEQSGLKNAEQAQKITDCLGRWGIPVKRVKLIADGSMWNKKTIDGVQFPPDIEAFQKAGFRTVPASEGALANRFRNRVIREKIREDGTGMQVQAGFNSRLVECVMGAKHDTAPGKVEQVLHDECSHMVVALGNAVSSYDTKPGEAPASDKTAQEEYDETNAAAAAAALEARNARMGLRKTVDADGRVRWVSAKARSRRPLGV
jgi:hypothetical protein